MTGLRTAANPRMKEIWDIGHSTLPFFIFAELLQKNRIEGLADIRRFPTSKKSHHFARPELAKNLAALGITYYWFGPSLGGYRKGGFESWMKSQEFKQGMVELEKLAREKRIAVMCAEKYFGRCHRRYILDLLIKQGWTVHHLIPERGRDEFKNQFRPTP